MESSLAAPRVNDLVANLRPVLEKPGLPFHWRPVDAGRKSSVSVASVCLLFQTAPGDQDRDCIDGQLAMHASLWDGEVVRYGETAIITVFPGDKTAVARALRCALGLAADERLEHLDFRVGVDYAQARQVTRAVGTMWEGEAIRGCRRVLTGAPQRKKGVFLTESAATSAHGDPWPGIKVGLLTKELYQLTN